MMIKQTDIETLLIRFGDAASKHGAATETGDHKMANRNHAIIIKTVKYIDKYFRRDVLQPLLISPDAGVRLWAASYTLPINEAEAVRVLEALSEEQTLVGFSAKMTVKEWKKGNLSDFFKLLG